MDPSKGLGQNLDGFKKMTIELANVGEKEKLSDKNEAIILLNSLPESFKDVKETLALSLKSKDQAFESVKAWKRYRTVRHTPQQNGVAERMNRIVLEKVEESQNQLEINSSLANYELVRDRARRIIKPNRSVMYSMISTRPDLAQAINVLFRYMSNPGKGHWNAIKWLLRYISSTTSVGLVYDCSNSVIDLVGYVDSNYTSDKDKRRSTSSYFFTIAGCCVNWKSQLQSVVALSTTEAEYIVVTEAIKEATWLQNEIQVSEAMTCKREIVFEMKQREVRIEKRENLLFCLFCKCVQA
ncbi:hypothetical protein EZV62_015721 [Acer yangbiense]|uniref:Integrase catalytic domain-containing protein n=1 Tax=Acer yangbiense TaxID=1000413 RepID=A0A5C7HNX2_9ROSI|nr:hypothetical protein EZV62_015721 [Acer yangbiense]